jgi:predicted nuclease with RNAse H fold
MRIWGIDYGSKLAGTTSIASIDVDIEKGEPKNGRMQCSVSLNSTVKKQDADAFILELAKRDAPELIFLDAPLSLPKAYFGDGTDYFYRPVDRLVGAMSPMFLGGLTARAMQLCHHLKKHDSGLFIQETYPKIRAQHLLLIEKGYKKEIKNMAACVSVLLSENPEWNLERGPVTWHEFDALLALSSGVRFVNKKSIAFGEMGEAQIVV